MKSCTLFSIRQRSGDFTRVQPSLFSFFLGKTVIAESCGIKITGKLVCLQNSNREGHVPEVLVIENEAGRHILRGNWVLMTEVKP